MLLLEWPEGPYFYTKENKSYWLSHDHLSEQNEEGHSSELDMEMLIPNSIKIQPSSFFLLL